MSKVLYVDSKDNHENDDCMSIHPSHLNYANSFEKEYFDKINILNTKSEFLNGKAFFNLCKCLKHDGRLELVLDQPISVMQQMDAGEIEANAKLGGFKTITTKDYDYYVKSKDGNQKISTWKLTMFK